MPIDRLSVYDDNDRFCRSFGENRDALRKLAITGGIGGLKNSWDSFVKSPGGPYSRVVFDTHGNAGMIFFKGQALRWSDVTTIFGKHDYGHIFPFFTRVYFDGCNVAEGDFGWLFLQEIAKAFCRTGGGMVFGWTSKGYTFGIGGHTAPHKWVHPFGKVRYVVARPGGRIDDMFDSVDLLPAIMPPIIHTYPGQAGGGGKVDEVAKRRLDLVRS